MRSIFHTISMKLLFLNIWLIKSLAEIRTFLLNYCLQAQLKMNPLILQMSKYDFFPLAVFSHHAVLRSRPRPYTVPHRQPGKTQCAAFMESLMHRVCSCVSFVLFASISSIPISTSIIVYVHMAIQFPQEPRPQSSSNIAWYAQR